MEHHRKIIYGFGKLVLAAIFFYAGAIKASDLPAFSDAVTSFQILPPWLVPHITTTIPPLEILLATMLLWRPMEKGAAAGATLLCIGFITFYTIAWLNNISPTCGCFGKNPIFQASPLQGVFRALSLGIISGALWASPRKI